MHAIENVKVNTARKYGRKRIVELAAEHLDRCYGLIRLLRWGRTPSLINMEQGINENKYRTSYDSWTNYPGGCTLMVPDSQMADIAQQALQLV